MHPYAATRPLHISLQGLVFVPLPTSKPLASVFNLTTKPAVVLTPAAGNATAAATREAAASTATEPFATTASAEHVARDVKQTDAAPGDRAQAVAVGGSGLGFVSGPPPPSPPVPLTAISGDMIQKAASALYDGKHVAVSFRFP
jgi:hypothetical protein